MLIRYFDLVFWLMCTLEIINSNLGYHVCGFLIEEAYEEFKPVLLAFIFDKDDQISSPVETKVCKNF